MPLGLSIKKVLCGGGSPKGLLFVHQIKDLDKQGRFSQVLIRSHSNLFLKYPQKGYLRNNAEVGGFEPPRAMNPSGFQDRCNKPLCDTSLFMRINYCAYL